MLKVKDLKDQIGTKWPRPVLYCSCCEVTLSANAGDYFECEPDEELTCYQCEVPLKLVIEKTIYEEVNV